MQYDANRRSGGDDIPPLPERAGCMPTRRGLEEYQGMSITVKNLTFGYTVKNGSCSFYTAHSITSKTTAAKTRTQI